MQQHTTNTSMSTTSTKTPGLLRLPASVRHRIYQLVGLERIFLHGDDAWSRHVCAFPLHLDPLCQGKSRFIRFHGLLLSCKTIYEEASQLLYSTGFFEARYDDGEDRFHGPKASLGLAGLDRLRPNSIRALRHLKIVLVETSCHGSPQRRCCVFDTPLQYQHYDCQHDDPLDDRAGAKGDRLLAEWDRTAARLASFVTEGELSLSFVCDVSPTDAGVQMAQAAVTSLLRFPRLKSCKVRLCGTQYSPLQHLAHDTVSQARRIVRAVPSPPPPLSRALPSSSSHSPLLALPREIRLRILSFTDLVTPWCEVTWSREQHGFVVVAAERNFHNTDPIAASPSTRQHGWRFRECEHVNSYPSDGCFCRGLHSAYSSPLLCHCWTKEGAQALFLTCRSLCEDARVVFYSENRFVVHDALGSNPYDASIEQVTDKLTRASNWERETTSGASDYPFARLAASIFLQDVVPAACLGHLRLLELAFPLYSLRAWPDDDSHPALLDWKNTLEWAISDSRPYPLNAAGMTLRVVAAEIRSWHDQTEEDCDWVEMTNEQKQQVQMCYERVLRPIASTLGGSLRRFYAHLAWPHDTWTTDDYSTAEVPVEKKKEQEMKLWAEELVLGDRYRVLHGVQEHSEPEPSIWRDSFLWKNDWF